MRPAQHLAFRTQRQKDLEKLRLRCPKATPSERKRFLDAKGGDFTKALAQLNAYLEWRNEHGLDDIYHCSKSLDDSDGDDPTLGSSSSSSRDDEPIQQGDVWHSCASDEERLDELDWMFASKAALSHVQRCSASKQATTITTTTTATATTSTTNLPQLTRILPNLSGTTKSTQTHCDRFGHRILQFLPAMMDLSKASETAFALSIALYLERKLDRNSDEKITVAIDVRGGVGWANPKPQKLIPFVKQVASVLEQNFPERLERCLVFPVPGAATWLYRIIKPFLDPSTVQKVFLVKGDSKTEAPAPYDAMQEHIGSSALKHMEDFREASFVVMGRDTPTAVVPTIY